MATHPGIFKYGNKFRTNMTSLEFLEYSRNHKRPKHDASYYKPKRDENGDPVQHYNGSAAAVKGLRAGFQALMAYTDSRFTGRLMHIVSLIYQCDSEGEQGKKSVYFSRERGILWNIQFNVRVNHIDLLTSSLRRVHSEERTAATLIAKEFELRPCYVPVGTTHFRILHHLSIISDFALSEDHQCYEPLSKLSGLSAIAYSEYTPVGNALNEEIKVAFPLGTVLSEEDSVIACQGIVFYTRTGGVFDERNGSGVMIADLY
jgi:hypothetical protein